MFFGGQSNQTLGLDIGTHSIKAVLCEFHHKTPRVVKAGVREIRGEAPYEPKKLRKSETLLTLRELMGDLRINPGKVKSLVTSLGGPATSMKEIVSVRMTEEELASSLIFEARKHLPLDDSDTIIDHQTLGEDPEDPQKTRILLVATTRKMYGWHEGILREAGFKPGVVDLEPLAVLNSFAQNAQLPDQGMLLFLNLGARGTQFIITGRQTKVFYREIPLGGWHLSEDLARQKSLPIEEAEERKRKNGVAAFHGGNGDGSSALALQQRTVLEDFLDEIRRTLRFYAKESGKNDFGKVLLTGGGAAMPGLPELLTEKFNLPVEAWNPLAELEGAENLPLQGPQFAQCVGLAMRRD
ncbi:MAG: type IV pilus assembly protein PilM [bacterium]|nr:type IV pilus assembly protein PilM [bacterium]